ncbi:hypothetical protein C7387_4150 [Yokenella regensburgei]|jgi:hypothetical protein|uniref:Uncharacterized protein n=1 Tax=Yokenella regensburgei TaxID=158877 RepID=A0ABX9RUZ0_9ENTR|nr:hypothetical protein FHR25_002656 [Yokenella regensburgei]RKR53015.1 hypothetical protein C7387_4150 [Yokenella regensburgei]SUQ06640.1 Uncharacterised protein [Yokenella regensburgei]VFS19715.1 Uncharacterised protein [Yokenella regensburgei]
MRRNLNAYNVLKQGGIVKPDDYANTNFRNGIIYQFYKKHVANHANKKQSDVHKYSAKK